MANDKWSGSNPWLGLAPYTEGTPLYGRTQESAVLSEIIKDNIATIVYGKSGIGKSSLLSAGISPMLRNEQYIPVSLRLVHNTEVSYVEQIENRVRELVDCIDELPENVPDLGLWDFFHRHTFTKEGTTCQPVIILDQFEEIYTLTDVEHKPEIIALFSELASLLNDIKPDAVLAAESSFTEGTTTSSSDDDFSFELSTESSFTYNETVSFRFVICLREDKLYLLERNSANIPSIKTNRYNLQALSPDSALEVITCPRPDLFDKEEADAIVDKLADMGDEGILTVDPAILSLFLYKYFEKKGEANYDNIFADYYREATKSIKDKSLAFLEDHLLTLGGYRNQVPLDDAIKSGVTYSDIQSLLNSIIIRKEQRKGIDYIEFSHDRLCAEAKKSRDFRKVEDKRRKNLLRVAMYVIIALTTAALGMFVYYHLQLQEKDATLKNKNQELTLKNDELIRKTGLLKMQKTKLETQKNDLEKKDSTNVVLRFNLETELNKNLLLSANLKDELDKKIKAKSDLDKALSERNSYADELAEKNKVLKIDNDSIQKLLLSQRFLTSLQKKHASESDEKRKLAEEYLQLVKMKTEQLAITNASVLPAFLACVDIRDAYGTRDMDHLHLAIKNLKDIEVSYFADITCKTKKLPSMEGHLIFDTDVLEKIDSKKQLSKAYKTYKQYKRIRGAANYLVYTLNSIVEANSAIEFITEARGYQVFAIVTEPGGFVDFECKLKDKNGNYIKSKSGKGDMVIRATPQHSPYCFVPIDTSLDESHTLELRIKNCTNKDISFVLITGE